MKMTTKKLAYYAMFAALTVICAQIAIPLPGDVPLSLATFAVMLSGALLGTFGGAVSQLVYVLLGAVGVPVFASFSGGLGRIVGPTGGYIIGYILMALIIGLIVTKTKKKFYIYLLAMAAGTIVCYTLGTAWYVFSTKTALLPALTACVFPFLPGDIVKIILASLVACQLQKWIKLS